MTGCNFHVSEKGRVKTVTNRRKGVHAWIIGEKYKKLDNADFVNGEEYEEVWYSPYFTQKFMGTKTGKKYETAEKVIFVNNKCFCKIQPNKAN